MSTRICIRPVVETDLPAITGIYAGYVLTSTATFEIEPPALAEMAGRWQAGTARGYPWLVAERDGQLLGYAYGGSFRARAAYDCTVEDSIYLADAARGQRVGSLLLAELIARCHARGYRQMLAVIGDSANVASIRFHSAFGFRETGRLIEVGEKFGRRLDVVLMQRALALD